MKTCLTIDLGLMGYAEAWKLQERLVAARKTGLMDDVLLLCEHPHVITLGRNGKREHLLASDHLLRQMNVAFHVANRGGDITYHGPGQIVGYPILNLAAIRRDVVWYVRRLEEAMIRATGDFGIEAGRVEGKTGVWVKAPDGNEEKLAAIGVHISRWITSHGFAYNVATDLRYFDLIVPCGIPDRRPTSLEKLLGRTVDRAEAAERILKHFGKVFELQMEPVAGQDLLVRLEAAEAPAAISA